MQQLLFRNLSNETGEVGNDENWSAQKSVAPRPAAEKRLLSTKEGSGMFYYNLQVCDGAMQY